MYADMSCIGRSVRRTAHILEPNSSRCEKTTSRARNLEHIAWVNNIPLTSQIEASKTLKVLILLGVVKEASSIHFFGEAYLIRNGVLEMQAELGRESISSLSLEAGGPKSLTAMPLATMLNRLMSCGASAKGATHCV